jgi:hypothetical protein
VKLLYISNINSNKMSQIHENGKAVTIQKYIKSPANKCEVTGIRSTDISNVLH